MEGYSGVGRVRRRLMVRLWKESGSTLTLKEWARKAEVGDIAHVWLRTKTKGGKGERSRSSPGPRG